MATSTRALLVIAVVACCVLFAIGILIGHFAIAKDSDSDDDGEVGDSQYLLNTRCDGTTYSADMKKYKDTLVNTRFVCLVVVVVVAAAVAVVVGRSKLKTSIL